MAKSDRLERIKTFTMATTCTTSSSNNMTAHLFLHVASMIYAAYILLTTVPSVHCDELVDQIDCRYRCVTVWPWAPTLSISERFRCPVDCRCILGHWMVTLTCPGGISSVQVLYPPSVSVSVNRGRYDYIVALSWSDTGIHGMEQDAFSTGFTQLKGLYLSNNRIVELHCQQFAGLTMLSVLNLRNNDIAKLHSRQFEDLGNLFILELSYNNIVELQPQQFAKVTHLSNLILSHNDIVDIVEPQQFTELTRLSRLDLSNIFIVALHPNQFTGLTRLYMLDLSDNFIVALHPNQFASLTRLTLFYLGNNYIAALHPYQLAGLKNLRYVYLLYNDIIELHPQ